MDNIANYDLSKLTQTIDETQSALFVIGAKLRSLGSLLERQDEDSESFSELYGLGLTIRELGEEVERLMKNLDRANFTPIR